MANALGVLETYLIDGDECFGLYIQLNEHRVFVDIKEDKYLDARKEKALNLFANQQLLANSLSLFVQANPIFATRQPATIGLHAKSLDQGEVFWNPTGYTLLKGLTFELE